MTLAVEWDVKNPNLDFDFKPKEHQIQNIVSETAL